MITQYLSEKDYSSEKLNRKLLILTSLYNDRFISKHNCSMTNIAEYQNKILNNISKLKEIWKNNYKNYKM